MKKAFPDVSIDFLTATRLTSTQFERNDIDVYGSYSGKGLIAMHRLVDPLFQSKTDFDIFTELTRRFGRHKEYTEVWMKCSGSRLS